MTSAVTGFGDARGLRESRGHVRSAAARRRISSAVLDGLLLFLALGLVLGTELAIATGDEAGWVVAGWTLVFSPLYFALYHAYGTGATPGQLELRIGLRDAGGRRRPGLGRAIARSYVGFAFLVLVVPALVDLLSLAAGRTLRDRLTGTAVVDVALEGKAPELAQPTAPAVLAVFEPPPGTRSYLGRGWTLLRTQPRLVVGSVAAVFAVLALIAAVLGFLLVADWPDEWTYEFYASLVLVLLVSGIYWTQAASVVAAEQIRTGSTSASVWETLVRASRRANALTAALVLLLIVLLVVLLTFWLVVPILLLARLTLTVPALVLEDTRVLGAFRRSWQLTRGQTWRLTGLLLLSTVIVFGAARIAGAVAVAMAVAPATAGAVAARVGLTVMLLVPVLAWLGSAWSLVYEDARRARPPGGEG